MSSAFLVCGIKRQAIIAGIILLGLIVVWCVWAEIAHRRLQREVDAIHARHEPLDMGDFDVATVPDGQNAARYYVAAAAALDQNVFPPASSDQVYAPLSPPWIAMANAAVAANAKALVLARNARQFERSDWGYRAYFRNFNWDSARGPFNNLQASRALANLLSDGALQAHSRGDDCEALERIEDTLHMAESMAAEPTVITRLVAIGEEAEVIDHAMVLAPRLRIGTSSGSVAQPASRGQVVKLIQELLDDQRERRGERAAVLYERARGYESGQLLGNWQRLLRPLFDLETARMLESEEVALRAADAQDWPAAKQAVANLPRGNTPVPNGNADFAHAFGLIDWAIVPLYYQVEWQFLETRRALATSLALQLFRLDHKRWPATLDELVPTYLPAVPYDSLQGGGTHLGYWVQPASVTGGADRPLIFFGGSPIGNPPPAHPIFSMTGPGLQWLDVSNFTVAQSPASKPSPK